MSLIYAIVVIWISNCAARKRGYNLTEIDKLNWAGTLKYDLSLLEHNPNITFLSKPRFPRTFLPAEFDARKKWTKCKKVFDFIKNQGNCGSSWALATATLISQMHCIGTNGNIQFIYSAQELLSCSPSPKGDGCAGGFPDEALRYWLVNGVSSGGEVGSEYGCVPYSGRTFLRGKSPRCPKECTNKNYEILHEKDTKRGSQFKALKVKPEENAIQLHILNYGPVLAVFCVYDDFRNHTSAKVYRQKWGEKRAAHAVVISGWGKDGRDPYWLVQNSWGKYWGRSGYCKITREQKHLQIEDHVIGVITTDDPTSKLKKKTGRVNLIADPRQAVIPWSGGEMHHGSSKMISILLLLSCISVLLDTGSTLT